MLRLIVHADDFGLTEEINEGIKQAHVEGILTSTSIIPCSASFEHAVMTAKSLPTLDIGIHLTLVEEKPLSDKHLISSIVTEEGNFFAHAASFFKKYIRGKINTDHVYIELDRQIQKVKDAGLPISHLDSHQHIHILPEVYKEVVKLAEKYKIHAVRVPKEKIRWYMLKPGRLRRVLELRVLNFICNLSSNANYTKTDYFTGFYYGGNMNTDNLLRTLSGMKNAGVYELMCHPGNLSTTNKYRHWNYLWEEELSALTDPFIRNYLSKKKISLISYTDMI